MALAQENCLGLAESGAVGSWTLTLTEVGGIEDGMPDAGKPSYYPAHGTLSGLMLDGAADEVAFAIAF